MYIRLVAGEGLANEEITLALKRTERYSFCVKMQSIYHYKYIGRLVQMSYA